MRRLLFGLAIFIGHTNLQSADAWRRMQDFASRAVAQVQSTSRAVLDQTKALIPDAIKEPLFKTATTVCELCGSFYEADALRTAAVRLAMAYYFINTGDYSAEALTSVALAVVSAISAMSYDGTSSQRCCFLPSDYNLAADAVAAIISMNIDGLLIAGTPDEAALRSALSVISTTASVVGMLR